MGLQVGIGDCSSLVEDDWVFTCVCLAADGVWHINLVIFVFRLCGEIFSEAQYRSSEEEVGDLTFLFVAFSSHSAQDQEAKI